jgi:hypothetical protein
MWWLNVLFVVEAHCGHGPARWRRTIIKLLAAGARQAMSSPRPSRPFATVKGLAKFVVDRRRPWPPPATSSRCHATGRRPVHWRAARLPTALASLHRPTTSRSINLRTGSPMCGRQLQILRSPLLRRLAVGVKARYRHRRSARAAAKSTSLADQSGLSGLAAPLEAVEQPAQRPQVVWVDLSAGQRTAEPKILAINHLSLCRAALFQQQRTQRVVLQRAKAASNMPRR